MVAISWLVHNTLDEVKFLRNRVKLSVVVDYDKRCRYMPSDFIGFLSEFINLNCNHHVKLSVVVNYNKRRRHMPSDFTGF